jgi:predicted Zn-dependent protease
LPARVRTASAIAKQGKLDEARAFLRSVSAQNEPQRVQLLVAESQLLREANLNKEAFNLLGEALAKSPDQPDCFTITPSPRRRSTASTCSNRA